MAYIKSIFEKASKFGICKIVPPDNWNPDFAIDTEVRLLSTIRRHNMYISYRQAQANL